MRREDYQAAIKEFLPSIADSISDVSGEAAVLVAIVVELREIKTAQQAMVNHQAKLNGSVDTLMKCDANHEVRLALLEQSGRWHSINWDRVIKLGLGVLEAVLIVVLLGALAKIGA